MESQNVSDDRVKLTFGVQLQIVPRSRHNLSEADVRLAALGGRCRDAIFTKKIFQETDPDVNQQKIRGWRIRRQVKKKNIYIYIYIYKDQ